MGWDFEGHWEMMRATASPRALSIAGSDSGGGAGIQADLKAFARCGVHGMTAITAITAQSTVGVQAVEMVPAKMVLAQVRAVVDDIGVDAVKVGMLGTVEVTLAVAQALDELPPGTPVVVDPVMVAESGARLLQSDAQRALVEEILPRATVLTPNLPEARVLAAPPAGDRDDGVERDDESHADEGRLGRHEAAVGGQVNEGRLGRHEAAVGGQVNEGRLGRHEAAVGGQVNEGRLGRHEAAVGGQVNEGRLGRHEAAVGGQADAGGGSAEAEALARAVLVLGPRIVVLTGGHRTHAVDLFIDGDDAAAAAVEIPGIRHPDGAAHGSGCTHSAVLAAALALGQTPLEAARTARRLAGEAVRQGLRDIGAGAGPVNIAGLEAYRSAIIDGR